MKAEGVKKDKGFFTSMHPSVLIFLLIILATIATYVVPAGLYDRYTDETLKRTLIDPTSYHRVEQTPVNPFQMMQAISTGMNEAGWIIFLVFIIGGSFGIINRTNAIVAGLGRAANIFKNQAVLLIVGLMFLFSLGGASFAMAESTLAFVAMCVLFSKALGYDAIVGLAIVNLGATIGFTAGWMNMYTTGVAQGIAGLPLFSGMPYRLVCHAVVLIVGVSCVLLYARKVKANPETSKMYGEPEIIQLDMHEMPEYNTRHKLVIVTLVIGFGILIYGILNGWSTTKEICALFLTMGIICGFIGGLTTNQIAEAFFDGARGIVFGALIVGICRTIVVVMSQGQIIDTILHSLAGVLDGTPPVIAAGLMVPIQMLINFLINSGSGQAATTMPIMAPLADILGVPTQTAVLAFQFGDGLSNSLWPTSGVLMASLAIAGIPYEKWLAFVIKPMIAMYITATVLAMISTYVWAV